MPRDDNEPHNTVNLAGTMPKGPANGLLAIVDDLIEHPQRRRYAVVEFDTMRRVSDTDDGKWQAIVRFRQIEPMSGEHASAAEAMMVSAQTERLGQLNLTSPEG